MSYKRLLKPTKFPEISGQATGGTGPGPQQPLDLAPDISRRVWESVGRRMVNHGLMNISMVYMGFIYIYMYGLYMVIYG